MPFPSLFLSLYFCYVIMYNTKNNIIILIYIRQGFKKNGNFHFWVWTPPLESGKNNVFFSETRPLFEHFLKKSVFSPLKIPPKKIPKSENNFLGPATFCLLNSLVSHNMQNVDKDMQNVSRDTLYFCCDMVFPALGGPEVPQGGTTPPKHEKTSLSESD